MQAISSIRQIVTNPGPDVESVGGKEITAFLLSFDAPLLRESDDLWPDALSSSFVEEIEDRQVLSITEAVLAPVVFPIALGLVQDALMRGCAPFADPVTPAVSVAVVENFETAALPRRGMAARVFGDAARSELADSHASPPLFLEGVPSAVHFKATDESGIAGLITDSVAGATVALPDNDVKDGSRVMLAAKSDESLEIKTSVGLRESNELPAETTVAMSAPVDVHVKNLFPPHSAARAMELALPLANLATLTRDVTTPVKNRVGVGSESLSVSVSGDLAVLRPIDTSNPEKHLSSALVLAQPTVITKEPRTRESTPAAADLATRVRDFAGPAPDQFQINSGALEEAFLVLERLPSASPALATVGDLIVLLLSEAHGPGKHFPLSPKMKQATSIANEVRPADHPESTRLNIRRNEMPHHSLASPSAKPCPQDLPPTSSVLEMLHPAFNDHFDFQLVSPGPAKAPLPNHIAGTSVVSQLPAVVAQIIQTAAGKTGPVTEIAFSPEELGRVRLSIRTHESDPSRVVVMMNFDRPEVMDLFRRHAEQLLADIRAAGFSGADLGFSRSDTQDKSGRRHDTTFAPEFVPDPLLSRAADAQLRPVSGSSLDLRL